MFTAKGRYVFLQYETSREGEVTHGASFNFQDIALGEHTKLLIVC
jgi:hypothetical protein